MKKSAFQVYFGVFLRFFRLDGVPYYRNGHERKNGRMLEIIIAPMFFGNTLGARAVEIIPATVITCQKSQNVINPKYS